MKKTKKIYEVRTGAPFRKEDVQEIGEFIDSCEDKSTRGILEKIKKSKDHKIYSLIEWDKNKASDLYQLQRVREIVAHIEIKIIRLGDYKPTNLNVSVSAFTSVHPVNSEERVYVPFEEGMNKQVYREQIIKRAKTELRNWVEKYNQYKELETIIQTLQQIKI